MKTFNNYNWRREFSICILLILSIACIRDIDELEPATFSTNPAIFLDGFSSGLNYTAFGGSVPTAFNVDTEVTFTTTSQASMRFEVPDANDPRGAYAGGAFFTDVARDLSDYDALTFWAKATKAATIDVVGFGNDLGESKYEVSINGLAVNTNWKKYYIPIPDASRLTAERGMFYYSEGPEEGRGYTFWIDDLKFEKLGTISQARHSIVNGVDQVETSFIGASRRITGLQSSFNLPNGVDQIVNVAPSYFEFASSNTSIASVDAGGNVSVVGGPGNTKITATLGNAVTNGSLTIQSIGQFQAAPIPTHPAADVISIFSDAYTNVPVDYFNGFWEPFQTTLSADFEVNGDRILNYFNFNFVGIEFTSPTINATAMTHLHVDIFLPNVLSSDARFTIELVDNTLDGSGAFTTNIPVSQSQQWISLDIPLSSFAGLRGRASLAQIIFVDGSGNIPGFYADNIYLYKAAAPPAVLSAPAPTPTRNPAGVISMFSDAYNDVPVDTWRTDWSSAILEDISIQGDAIKKYSALDFVGIETVNNQINIETMTHLHVDVWSADFTNFGIKLVDFGPDGGFNGGDDTEHQVDFADLPTGEWVSLDIPLNDFTGLTTRKNLAQMILVAQPSGGAIVHIDNMYFYDENAATTPIGLSVPAPTPTRPASGVISMFSDAYPNVTVDTWRTDWSSAVLEDILVQGNAVKKYSSLDFVGIETVSNQINIENMTHMHMDVWSADFTNFAIKLVDFGPDGGFGGGDDTEHQVDFATPAQGRWVSLDIPLSNFTNLTTRKNLAQMILVGQPTGTTIVHIDNVYFYDVNASSGSATLTAPAPAPSLNAGDVISMFSDSYTNVAVDTWRTDWSAAVLEDISLQGNTIKKYSSLDFVGIETVSNQINIEEMTHLHMDVWSSDFTFFGIKLVDFGPDGGFGGGDDTEHQINIESPAKGRWVRLEIPLSSFSGLTTRKNLAQMILVGQPSGATTVHIDNVLFYKAAATGGGGGSETGTTIFEEKFNQASSINGWEKLADANSSEASVEWLSGAGVEGGAMQITGRNPSTAAGKAYIFQTQKSGLNFGGKTKVKLTFDLKLNGPLVAAAVHLQTNFPGLGVTNNFDLQATGLSQSSWTSFSFEFENVAAAADNFFMHFNIASGAVEGAGGVILIDKIRLSGID